MQISCYIFSLIIVSLLVIFRHKIPHYKIFILLSILIFSQFWLHLFQNSIYKFNSPEEVIAKIYPKQKILNKYENSNFNFVVFQGNTKEFTLKKVELINGKWQIPFPVSEEKRYVFRSENQNFYISKFSSRQNNSSFIYINSFMRKIESITDTLGNKFDLATSLGPQFTAVYTFTSDVPKDYRITIVSSAAFPSSPDETISSTFTLGKYDSTPYAQLEFLLVLPSLIIGLLIFIPIIWWLIKRRKYPKTPKLKLN